MRISLSAKLVASYLTVVLLVVAPSLWLLRRSLDRSLERAEQSDLKGRVEAVRDRLGSLPDSLRDDTVAQVSHLLGARVTVIAPDGAVLSDSAVGPERLGSLENHSTRPEVAAALRGEVGTSRRFSATVGTELIYVAVPLPQQGTPRAVVRLATPASTVRSAVSSTLLALRLSAGMGVTAAILFSLLATLSVARPLRRMRDAARSFGASDWVRVRIESTGDELEELSRALDDLGQKLSAKLVEVGAQEALVVQAVGSVPLPALLLEHNFAPLSMNGAFRRFGALDAAGESAQLAQLLARPTVRAARAEAEASGLPVRLLLYPTAAAEGLDESGAQATLVPLSRCDAPPLWLLVVDGAETFLRSGEEVHRHLHGADTVIDRLWNAEPTMRPVLAELRHRLDGAAYAAGRSSAVGIEPSDLTTLMTRAVDEVRVLHPSRAALLQLEQPSPCPVAESAGMAARALRLLVGGALRALSPGRSLELRAEVEHNQVKLFVDGAAPVDLRPILVIARTLGGDAQRVEHREREAAWLTLPRA